VIIERLGSLVRTRTLVAGAFLALVATACTAPPIVEPESGDPGSNGPCGFEEHHRTNEADWRHDLVVFEPTGAGEPYTGGTCDGDDRPVVLFSHGYLGNIAEGYRGMLEHLVSNGFVVVFPGYTAEYGTPWDQSHRHQYEVVDTGFEMAAEEFAGRMDLSRIGMVGHSFGAGMQYWLAQRAEARGWGTDVFWAVNFAPWFAMDVGTGTIEMPDNMRFVMVSFQEDAFVDARIGNEQYRNLDVPDDRKTHIMALTDQRGTPAAVADHIGPVSVTLLPGLGTVSLDHYDYWVSFRTIDAVSGCELSGIWCDTDFTYTGTFPDGREVRKALVTHDMPDIGPPALQECEFFLNPRPCH
jgi:hypothetical protein